MNIIKTILKLPPTKNKVLILKIKLKSSSTSKFSARVTKKIQCPTTTLKMKLYVLVTSRNYRKSATNNKNNNNKISSNHQMTKPTTKNTLIFKKKEENLLLSPIKLQENSTLLLVMQNSRRILIIISKTKVMLVVVKRVCFSGFLGLSQFMEFFRVSRAKNMMIHFKVNCNKKKCRNGDNRN